MTFGLSTALVLTTLLAQGPSAGGVPSAELTLAKNLYASASYEEALSHLTVTDGARDAEQIDQYRALCLLALGRTADAQRALERIVAGKPLYKITDADVSPRLVAMFHDVRRRLLPGAARDLYLRAKTDFDGKNYAAASPQLKDVLAILGDEDFADQSRNFGDLKLLAEGFLKLSDAEVAAAAKAVAAVAPAAPPPTSVPAKVEQTIFSAMDKDVSPPSDLDRRMPPWNPTSVVARLSEYRGVLEIVINERGGVDSATLRRSVAAFYDPVLLEAAKKWRFRPATRNGQPVKYLKLVEIVLTPR